MSRPDVVFSADDRYFPLYRTSLLLSLVHPLVVVVKKQRVLCLHMNLRPLGDAMKRKDRFRVGPITVVGLEGGESYRTADIMFSSSFALLTTLPSMAFIVDSLLPHEIQLIAYGNMEL